jgi:hypothetical protein
LCTCSNDEFWGKLTVLKNQKALDLKFQLIRRIHSHFDPEVIEDLESFTSSTYDKYGNQALA